MSGYQFVWNVRCSTCLAAAVGDELHCQSWAAAHRCPPAKDAAWGDRLRRFMAKVEVDPDGCWLWRGARKPTGYGNFFDGERYSLAHRWSYATLIAPIPDGLNVDHLCNVTSCVNPTHLEPVTQSENLRRAAVRRGPIAACQRGGHLYDEANTYVDRRGYRHCRACRTHKTPGDLPAETQPSTTQPKETPA